MLAAAVPSLAVATIAVAFFQNVAGVANASAIYLVAVVVTAFVAGTWGGIVAAVASFLLTTSCSCSRCTRSRSPTRASG